MPGPITVPGRYAFTSGSAAASVGLLAPPVPLFPAPPGGLPAETPIGKQPLVVVSEIGSTSFISGNTATVSTSAFTPAAGCLLVAFCAQGNGVAGTASLGTLTDSVSGTWTRLSGFGDNNGVAEIWVKDAGPAPASQTVTYDPGGAGASGTTLIVKQYSNAATAAAQTGPTATTGSGATAYTVSLATTKVGSIVAGSIGRAADTQTLVAQAGTTIIGQFNGSSGDTAGAFRSSQPTTTPGTATYGFTNTPSGTQHLAVVEILPASTIAPSLRALGTPVSATTLTPSFAAPAGAVAADVVLILFFCDDGRSTVSAAPSGFTAIADLPQTNGAAGSPAHRMVGYWGRYGAVGAGPYAFTLTNAAGTPFVEGRTAAIQNCVTTGTPYEASDGNTSGLAASTTAPVVSGASTGQNRYAFYAATDWSGGAWTPPDNFTEQWDANNRIVTFADRALPATPATYSPQAVCASSNDMNAWMGIFLPAAVSSGPTTYFGDSAVAVTAAITTDSVTLQASTAAVSATATIAASAAASPVVSASVAATASIGAAASTAQATTATVATTASIAAATTASRPASAAVTTSAAVAASEAYAAQTSVAVSATASLTTAAAYSAAGQVAVATTALLAAASVIAALTAASAATSATLTAAMSATAGAAAARATTATITAAETYSGAGAAAQPVTVTITSAGTAASSSSVIAAVATAATVSDAATAALAGSVSITTTATIAAAETYLASTSTSVSITASIAASASRTAPTTAAVAAIAALTTAVAATRVGAAVASASAALVVAEFLTAAASAMLAATAALSAAASGGSGTAVLVATTATVAATETATAVGLAAVTTAVSVNAAAVITTSATAAVSVTAMASDSAVGTRPGSSTQAVTVTVTAAATPAGGASTVLAVTAAFSAGAVTTGRGVVVVATSATIAAGETIAARAAVVLAVIVTALATLAHQLSSVPFAQIEGGPVALITLDPAARAGALFDATVGVSAVDQGRLDLLALEGGPLTLLAPE